MRNEDPNRFRLDDDPLWYKDAIIYEVHVRAFCDSNGDGVGDFPGLTRKLDYLQALGVTAIWLLPFFPSPLKDDGYDVADYDDVHPAYGFYSHQPDLNFENPRVHKAILDVMRFWLQMGVASCGNCAGRWTSASPTGCSWLRPTFGPSRPSPTSARATSATWPSTSP